MDKNTINKIATRYGWKVSGCRQHGSLYLEFRRTTLSGVPFSFTVNVESGRAVALFREILSFVDAPEPEQCASEWMVKSGAVTPSSYHQAVADMEDIKASAWLVAYDLGVTLGLMTGLSSC